MSTADSQTGAEWPSALPANRYAIASGLRSLGIGDGDTVFFHSSLRSLGRVEGGADTVIDSFLDTVGPTGTVVAPTFTLLDRVGPFGSWYDHHASPSTVGAVTEALRCRIDAVRSFHPIHSVAAIGRQKHELTAPHATAHGRTSPWCDAAFAHDSPLDLMVRRDVWYLLLGVGFHVQTIAHYVETILADEILRCATTSARDDLRAGIRTWGRSGVWASFDRVKLGNALVQLGAYQVHDLCGARVHISRGKPLVRAILDIVLGEPEQWLNEPFRAWMGASPDAASMHERYTSSAGVPALEG